MSDLEVSDELRSYAGKPRKNMSMHKQHCLFAANLLDALWECYNVVDSFVPGVDPEADRIGANVRSLFGEPANIATDQEEV